MGSRRAGSILPSAQSGTGSLMGDDKWKDIDNQISSMMEWIPSSQNQQGLLVSTRQGHTHRRSEPDVVMIRRALPQQLNNVPQSAPVQPGGFALDWNVNSAVSSESGAPSRHLVRPSDIDGSMSAVAGSSPAGGDMNHNQKIIRFNKEHPCTSGHSLTDLGGSDGLLPPDFNGHPNYVMDNLSDSTSAAGSGGSSPFTLARADSPSLNNPLQFASHALPITVVPEGLSQVLHHQFPASSRILPSVLSSSPKTCRRSSAPGNQLDPRSHSASPSITRRSTSHSAAMIRRKTQDGFIGSKASCFQPLTSTPSEHISTSISASRDTQPKNNSTYDDQEYTKVLLQHQQERMERLRKELKAKKCLLDSLTLSVAQMENEVFQKRNVKISTLMPSLNDVTKLREVNRQMEIDCNCMIKEVESVSKSGYPLNKNFHEFISMRNPVKKKGWPTNDLPSPPLPPPPIPPPAENDEENKWACHYCTFLNHAALNKCEMCEYRRETTTARARHQHS